MALFSDVLGTAIAWTYAAAGFAYLGLWVRGRCPRLGELCRRRERGAVE
ncbi:hypothetical protein Kfla_6008 [Kribbella flavida DSM 17836]|uniref:Uncharacterized protein n=1 Tax=Kribbella flavida (strain DSM 17836 / JCM 10339 / NBRC 14399) TaxID=479435 RepID=D2PSV9_KRIFD|nr:hypothetical protein Kfla_6008 [Kribbella flavida DSM 17836]